MKKSFFSLILVWVLCSSHTNFKTMLKQHKVKYHEIVYNQARLETGNFTSRGFKQLNNPLGFTLNGKLMKFKTLEHSVTYLKDLQARRMKKHEHWYDFLVRVKWATDKTYIDKLKQF
jgi:arsenate reductase-like glutaredoxin family protein